jgi:hypothetical protein
MNRPFDEDDPLAGAPEEVLAAFIALGGRAARVSEARRAMPTNAVSQLAQGAKLGRATPAQSQLLNRKA